MLSRRRCLSLFAGGAGASVLSPVLAGAAGTKEPRKIYPLRPRDPSPGNLVKQIQVSLRENGFDPGPIDGIYGRKTSRAIMDYQHWRGIPVTGVVSTDLLNRYLKEK
ncbi:MAG: peptidoglycan-binding protein [Burkholderiaceae bacterium]